MSVYLMKSKGLIVKMYKLLRIDLYCNIECDDSLSSQISVEFKSICAIQPTNDFRFYKWYHV